MTYFEQLERHLLDEILVFANLIQIPAVILPGGVAWLVCRPIRGWAVAWIRRVPEVIISTGSSTTGRGSPTGWCR